MDIEPVPAEVRDVVVSDDLKRAMTACFQVGGDEASAVDQLPARVYRECRRATEIEPIVNEVGMVPRRFKRHSAATETRNLEECLHFFPFLCALRLSASSWAVM